MIDIAHLEKKMRLEIVDIYKNIYGKGPEEICVKVVRDMIVINVKQNSIYFEDFISKYSDLTDDWLNFRKKMAKNIETEIFSSIISVCGVKPQKMIIDFDIQKKIEFGVILMEEKLSD